MERMKKILVQWRTRQALSICLLRVYITTAAPLAFRLIVEGRKEGCWLAMAGRKKVYGFAEVARHSDREDCWLIISGKVYVVTPYMEEHPGGDEVLLAVTGKDATADFDDTGHSKAAKETMSLTHYIGDIDPCTLPAKGVAADALRGRRKPSAGAGLWFTVLQIAVPLLLLGLAFAIQKLAMAKKEY